MVKPSTTGKRRGESGFTLAGVLVILTIVMVFVAYTVPKQWSKVMQREREYQTIYAMQQYARAIREFNKKHQSYPVSIDQLKEARLPRFIRGKGEFVDPLTGEVDWLVIPASAANPTPGTVSVGGGVGVGRGDGPGSTTTSTTSTTGTTSTDKNQPGQGTAAVPGIPLKDYAGGPFIGVRPNKTGDCIVEFRGAKTYDQWSYTSIDLEAEITQRNLAAATIFR
jgi:type II secretory pathway pseudopilin PulG